MSEVREFLVGDGTERVAVWTVVGSLVVFYAYPLLSVLGIDAAWVTIAAALVAAFGAAVHASVNRGVLACVLLVFGPVTAAMVRTLDPGHVTVPYAEPLAIALAGSTALGVLAYAAGRAARQVGGAPT